MTTDDTKILRGAPADLSNADLVDALIDVETRTTVLKAELKRRVAAVRADIAEARR